MISATISLVDSPTPALDMRSLIDFFNHGTLPFVGREGDLRGLIRFWQQTREAHGLRGSLLLGEGGIGKSRLLEEVIPVVVNEGGVVVHAKLYPGSTTSLAPLLARAIRFSGTGRHLLKKEPEDTIGSVIGALQRLSRLRPLFLVIEDIHLLSGDALGEFAMLLEALSGEAISLLSLARPVELGARAILERYLVEERELDGLGDDDLRQIWRELFNTEIDDALLALIAGATLGNALAIRSALRGVLKSGALARHSDGIVRPMVPPAKLGEALERNVRLLSEGMAAHLSDQEKQAAERLASLGEVFSREAARATIDDAERLIEILAFKGILVLASSSISPLPGPSSADPLLAFTHTLLHKHLAGQSPAEAAAMLGVIASELPLYSILPFQTLAESAEALTAPSEILLRGFDRSIAVAVELDRTTDWKLAGWMLSAAERIVHAGEWPADQARALAARLLETRLHLLRREDYTEEYATVTAQLLALTEEPLPNDLAECRLSAYRHLYLSRRRRDFNRRCAVWRMVDELLRSHPGLQFSRTYIMFLQSASSGTAYDADSETARVVEARLNAVLASPEASGELRSLALREVGPNFLWLFKNGEELERRLRLLASVEPLTRENDYPFQLRKVAFFDDLGHAHEVLGMIDAISPRLREHGLSRSAIQFSIMRICALAGLGAEPSALTPQAERIVAGAPAEIIGKVRERVGVRLSRIAALRGDIPWMRQLIGMFLESREMLGPEERLILAEEDGNLPKILMYLWKEGKIDPALAPLIALFNDEAPGDMARSSAALRGMLGRPILSRTDLLFLHTTLRITDVLGRSPEYRAIVTELRSDLREAIRRALGWLAAHSLAGFVAPLLDRYGAYLDEAEPAEWRGRIGGMALEEREPGSPMGDDGETVISMLGVIEARTPDGAPTKLRGGRLRTVLGLMVADRMLERPLSYREFCRLAAGGEDDPERARKMVSMAILRLRDAVGHALIMTDGETPRLNPELVRVDLLEADAMLREATAEAAHGGLVRSLPLLLSALDIIRAEVPFPTLYDDFFEAIREDFEYRMRAAIILVSRGLLGEGDPAGAEKTLRRGFDAMPEDEEIGELLCLALEQQGKRAEAERIRLSVEV